jgi:predicted transcriptional regulator
MHDKLQYHQWATSILKKGVQIQNKRLNENEGKAKHFDELMSKYKEVEDKYQKIE